MTYLEKITEMLRNKPEPDFIKRIRCPKFVFEGYVCKRFLEDGLSIECIQCWGEEASE